MGGGIHRHPNGPIYGFHTHKNVIANFLSWAKTSEVMALQTICDIVKDWVYFF